MEKYVCLYRKVAMTSVVPYASAGLSWFVEHRHDLGVGDITYHGNFADGCRQDKHRATANGFLIRPQQCHHLLSIITGRN